MNIKKRGLKILVALAVIIAPFLGSEMAQAVTCYSYTSTGNNTGWNWNAPNDNGAFSFTPTTSCVPTQILLRVQSISGSPVGDVSIRADKASTSTGYGSASSVSFNAGTTTINLSGGSTINSGTRYWVYISRTSAVTDFFRFYNEYASPPSEQYWYSTASNIEPNTRYDSSVKNIGVSIDVIGTVPAANTFDALSLAGD